MYQIPPLMIRQVKYCRGLYCSAHKDHFQYHIIQIPQFPNHNPYDLQICIFIKIQFPQLLKDFSDVIIDAFNHCIHSPGILLIVFIHRIEWSDVVFKAWRRINIPEQWIVFPRHLQWCMRRIECKVAEKGLISVFNYEINCCSCKDVGAIAFIRLLFPVMP